MTERHTDADRYVSALRDYLSGAGEAALNVVYEIGRARIGNGAGPLYLVALHHEALPSVLSRGLAPDEWQRTIRAAGELLSESLAPFEMAHRGIREANAALRRLNDALEDEARRIAHALHDDAGQLLAAVHVQLDEIAGDLPPRERQRLGGIKDLLDQVEVRLRQLSHEACPRILDDLGLAAALEFLAQGVSARTGLAVTVLVDDSLSERASRRLETVLYRVVQEALTNTSRHARATRVSVHVDVDAGAIRCAVRDDGVGFDAARLMSQRGRPGLGLVGMRERLAAAGGRLEIASAPGGGTTVSAEIPLGR